MDTELQFHIDAYTQELIDEGAPATEAKSRARQEFGNVTASKEECRKSVGLRSLDEISADLRFASRLLRKDRALTWISVLSLALGIGANTAIFAIAKGVLFDALGVSHPEQLRLLSWQFKGPNQPIPSIYGTFAASPEGFTSTSFSYPVYQELRRRTDVFSDLIAFKNMRTLTVEVNGNAQMTGGELVSANLFQALGVRASLGRTFTSSDATEGASAVAVISHAFWVSTFGQSRDVIGKIIRANSVPVTIVGVAPESFLGPQLGSPAQIFLPLTLQRRIDPTPHGDQLRNGDTWWLLLLGRLKPNITDAKAQAVMNSVFVHQVKASISNYNHSDLNRMQLSISPDSRGEDLLKSRLAQPLYLLLAFVALVLLLSCANVANLLLAKSTTRQREIQVRLALGAGRSRLIRQMLTESLLLSFAASGLGLVLAFGLRHPIAALLRMPNTPEFDWRVLIFVVFIACLTGIVFGIAPALHAFRTSPVSRVNESTRMSANTSAAAARKALVILQVVISSILLVGASLFCRTLIGLLHVETGFVAENLTTFRVILQANRYTSSARIATLHRIEESLAALPGVSNASLVELALVGGDFSGDSFNPNNKPFRDGRQASYNSVGFDFFTTLKIPLLRGRSFNRSDSEDAPKVAVINEALAKTYFPNEDPIGQMFNRHIQIVGICGDTKNRDLRESIPPTFYLPYTQNKGIGQASFYVRSNLGPSALASSLQKVVHGVDPQAPVVELQTQQELIEHSLAEERLFALLSGGFGLLALILASIGVYGVITFSVARRTNEIGIRLALGARSSHVVCKVLAEGVTLVLIGLAIGIASSLMLTYVIRTRLYSVTSADPWSFTIAFVLLLAVALLSAWFPARRAGRTDPMTALRHE